jgi:hypothetical protein
LALAKRVKTVSGERKMKKIIATAVGLMLVSGVAVTASAVESQFGGYWRTRSSMQKNFLQGNTSALDADGDIKQAKKLNTISVTDTRTRLYYTAKFNDDFKFVNKFEFNTTWGDNVGGDVGADGQGNWRIKNSYADFTLGMVNTKVGIQGATINRGFLFADDFSGVVVTADLGSVKVPLLYGMLSNEDAQYRNWGGSPASVKLYTNDVETTQTIAGGTGDVHLLSLMPKFDINENISVQPHLTYANVTHQDSYLWYMGTDIDAKFDAVSVWGTLLHNGGQIDKAVTGGTSDADISAWLFAIGADAGIFHGQAFYATGDDDATDNDVDSFVVFSGASYYWAEILGLGTFDDAANNSMGDKISNIMAANLGVTLKPMDKLTLGFDAWYVQNDEKVLTNGKMEDELGIELDTRLTYALMDNLKAEFVYAYLFAGDAMGNKDIQEAGVQLSLSF